jgi:hypothetical protein
MAMNIVNISSILFLNGDPCLCSLHSNSTLDENIKGQMVRDILNMAGFRLPPATKPDET